MSYTILIPRNFFKKQEGTARTQILSHGGKRSKVQLSFLEDDIAGWLTVDVDSEIDKPEQKKVRKARTYYWTSKHSDMINTPKELKNIIDFHLTYMTYVGLAALFKISDSHLKRLHDGKVEKINRNFWEYVKKEYPITK